MKPAFKSTYKPEFCVLAEDTHYRVARLPSGEYEILHKPKGVCLFPKRSLAAIITSASGRDKLRYEICRYIAKVEKHYREGPSSEMNMVARAAWVVDAFASDFVGRN